MTEERDQIELRPSPFTRNQKMLCPACGHRLPIDRWTECDRCGAHIRLETVIEAPPLSGYSNTTNTTSTDDSDTND